MILTDGSNSYISGPDNLPIEQINTTTGTIEYLHHDQQGPTRLITGSTGTVEAKCSYSAYGVPDCEVTATSPLGYDAQFTNSDTTACSRRRPPRGTAEYALVDKGGILTGDAIGSLGAVAAANSSLSESASRFALDYGGKPAIPA